MNKKKKVPQPVKRRLKIQPKHIARSYNRYVVFPEIRLCGKWLKEIGFDCGQFVTVLHEKNIIIITVGNETEIDE